MTDLDYWDKLAPLQQRVLEKLTTRIVNMLKRDVAEGILDVSNELLQKLSEVKSYSDLGFHLDINPDLLTKEMLLIEIEDILKNEEV